MNAAQIVDRAVLLTGFALHSAASVAGRCRTFWLLPIKSMTACRCQATHSATRARCTGCARMGAVLLRGCRQRRNTFAASAAQSCDVSSTAALSWREQRVAAQSCALCGRYKT